jgi:hypothetical protein
MLNKKYLSMKSKIKYIALIFSVAFIFSSCDEREYDFSQVSLDELEKSGLVSLTAARGQFQFAIPEEGQPFENRTFTLSVRVIGPPPAEDINVSFDILDNAGSAVVAKLGQQFTLSDDKFVIKAGQSGASITGTAIQENCEEGIDYAIPISLTQSSSASYKIHDVAVNGSFSLFKPCLFVMEKFDNAFLAVVNDDVEGAWEVSVTPNEEEKLITMNGIWLSVDEFILMVNKDDLSLVDPFGIDDEDWEGQYIGLYDETYGRVRFESVNGGKVLNTCTNDFEFYATPTLPDAGAWWGGEFHFRMVSTESGKKLEIVGHTRLPEPVKRY